jgi:hypothetical protein
MSTKQCDWLMKQMMQEEMDRKEQELMKRRGMIRRSPSEEMSSIGEYVMDKIDMSTVSTEPEEFKVSHTVIDPLLKEFEETVWHQQEKVLASGKYSNPIHKDNHTALEWMDHQMSEFADALVYHQCLKQTIMDVQKIIADSRVMITQGKYTDAYDHLRIALERL